MNKLNIQSWKEFLISDIFEIRNTHSIMKKEIEENSGEHPYVTASEGNNSVVSYISFDMTQIEEGNSILIGGKTLIISYQAVDYFSNDSHNLALYLKDESKRTKNIQLFLVTALRIGLSPLYSWGDSISKKTIQKDIILLPSKNGKTPDWDYMDNYMKGIDIVVKSTLTELQSIENKRMMSIDIRQWKKFHLYDIFDIDSGSKLDKAKMDTNDPIIDFVGRSNFNNGVTQKVNRIQGKKPYEAGNLTLALGGAYLGSCFVQTNQFYTSQNVVVLIPKINMSWEAKQFIATTIFIESQNNYRAFIKELNAHIKRNFTIKLPTTSKGEPDWEYMTSYMGEIKKNVSESLTKLQSTIK